MAPNNFVAPLPYTHSSATLRTMLSIMLFNIILIISMQANTATARTWRDIQPLHGYGITGTKSALSAIIEMRQQASAINPLFTDAPSQAPSMSPAPSAQPSMAPSRSPSVAPSSMPSASPTMADPYPVNEAPSHPDPWYFDYDTSPTAKYGPGSSQVTDHGISVVNNRWGSVANPPDNYWTEFGDPGFGAWAGYLAKRDVERNQCNNVGEQSPIDVRIGNGGKCDETHEIRSQVSRYLFICM
jgi:hypothetical protein